MASARPLPPKVFGFRLDDRCGYAAAICWVVGFVLVFFPLYAVGLMGMTRRTFDYSAAAFQPWMVVSAVGGGVVLAGFLLLVAQLVVSVRQRERLAVPAGDPWDGRSLEWSLPSPPPEWNFAVLPQVVERDDFARRKATREVDAEVIVYEDIELPKNTLQGPAYAVFGTIFGFAMVWYIWWLAAIGALAIVGLVIGRSFQNDLTRTVLAEEVAATDRAFRRRWRETPAIGRDVEDTSANRGRALLEAVT